MSRVARAPKERSKPEPERSPAVAARAPVQRQAAPAPGWSTGYAAPFALGGVQRKVAIGQVNDPYEQEAEHVAQTIASGGSITPESISQIGSGGPPVGQRAATPAPKKDEKRPVQRAAPPDGGKKKEDTGKKAPVQKAASPATPDKKKEGDKARPTAQKAAKPDEKKPVQKAAKPEEKKPVQKATAAAPGDKKEEGKKPVQKAAAAPADSKKKETQPPAAQRVEKERKGEERHKTAGEKLKDTPVQKAALPDEKEPESTGETVQLAAQPDAKKAEPKKESPKAAQRSTQPDKDKAKADAERSGPIQRDTDEHGTTSPSTMEHAAERALHNKGSGEPMHGPTRQALERGMGLDFSDVRVHGGGGAQDAARDLDARAFTQGHDIWLGAGESPHNVGLMAHEATHVAQQTGSVQRMLVQRAAKKKSASPTADAEEELKTFPLPEIKARHRPVYESWAKSKKLKRAWNYDRGNPEQKDKVWLPGIKVDDAALKKVHLDPTQKGVQVIELPKGDKITGTYNELLRVITVPEWDRHGKMYPNPFEVDHIVELQAAGWPGGEANTLPNMELLDKSSNASAGSTTMSGIRHRVGDYLAAQGQPSGKKEIDAFLAKGDLEFDKVEIVPSKRAESSAQWWTRDEIIAGLQIKEAKPVKALGEAGSATSFALLSPSKVSQLAEYPHNRNPKTIPIKGLDQTKVAGLRITAIDLNEGYVTATSDSPIGSLTATWDLPKGIKPPTSPSLIQIMKGPGKYAGYLGPLPTPDVDAEGASPIRFDKLSFEGGMISGTGRLLPTIPLLAKVPLEVRLRGRALELVYYYRPDDLSLTLPGLSIDTVSLGLFIGTEGLGAEGGIDFSITNLGRGSLSAAISTNKGFEAEGRFNFDSDLFDRAEITIWYRNKAFGGQGVLEIRKPGKIKGVKAAKIKATFGEGKFGAEGTVEPSIPGIREAGLMVSYSEAEGLTIGGTLALADNIPGISGGSVEVRLQKKPGENRWVVYAHGTAQPKIPGISSSISVTYDDGAFDIAGTAAYEKGLLKGSITVGATNRPIGEDGQPASAPPAGEARHIILYGGGSLSLRIAPWLEATAAVKLKPNGEIEVTGRIGLPAVLEIFKEKALDKNLFKIGIDIPIVGVAVAGQRIGIFANISGGLDLSAGIGPGQLQDLHLEVTYNPAHEEQTHVAGAAKLHIPAHAGLRMFVRGSLGVGIPIVSASAGLEIGGGLGLEGALDAAVNVDWTPTKGLDLTASAEIYVEPKLKFDITGFVLVEADLWITTIELYSKRWQLGSIEYGSGLRFGLRLPIHYQEGKPFDISFSDIEIIKPDLNAMDILTGLLKKIA